MNRVAVEPVLLRWASERSGLSADGLRRRFPKFKAWENKETQPNCQGRRETRPKGGAKHCHRGLRGEMVRGGRDEAGGGVSRKRREGAARAQFPAGGDAQIRSSSPCCARGCG